MGLVYLSCFINVHAQASLLGVRMGIGRESGCCCVSDPLDSLALPEALTTATETGIPAVTQY